MSSHLTWSITYGIAIEWLLESVKDFNFKVQIINPADINWVHLFENKSS